MPSIVDQEAHILMPAYNAERFIGDALHSALSQTYGSVKVIIYDDGSTDGTRKIMGLT